MVIRATDLLLPLIGALYRCYYHRSVSPTGGSSKFVAVTDTAAPVTGGRSHSVNILILDENQLNFVRLISPH